MKVAVTGGKGFQGRALVTRLETEGHEVVVYDRPEIDLRFEEPDFRGCDAVFHLAAVVGGAKDTHGDADSGVMVDNLTIDATVLSSIAADRVKRVVFASSASVYPMTGSQVVTEADWLDIKDLESGYAVAKLSTEAAIYRLQRIGEVPDAVVLRLFNVYGPGDKSTHVIPDLFRKIGEGKDLKLYGDGTERRCFLYIDDAVEAYVKALACSHRGPINVGGNEVISMGRLAFKVLRASKEDKMMSFEGNRQGVKDIIPDISLARSELGWEPRVSLDEGLRRFQEWRESA